MKIGILTFHCAYNYGALVQTYALKTILKNMGHNVEIIDYRPSYLVDPYKKIQYPHKYTHKQYLWKYILNICVIIANNILNYNQRKNRVIFFEESIKKHLCLSKEQYFTEIELFASYPKYDMYIAGSDQIWSPRHTGGKLDSVYFFANLNNHNTASYAASFGQKELLNEHIPDFKKYIKHINNISIRECSAYSFVKTNTDQSVKCVLDPTLLLTEHDWSLLSKEPQISKSKFLLVYNLSGNYQFLDFVKSVANKLCLSVVFIDKCGKCCKYFSKNHYVRPEEFVWYFAHASFIITDSFHGTMFSIINKKAFYTIAPYPQKTRIEDHLSRLGLLDRYFESVTDIKEINCDIDYDAVYKKLKLLRDKSLDYLREITTANTS